MRSEWRGVVLRQIQFPRNALPEMMVVGEKNESFISGDLGMLNWGLLILEMEVLLLGHLHKQSTVGPHT